MNMEKSNKQIINIDFQDGRWRGEKKENKLIYNEDVVSWQSLSTHFDCVVIKMGRDERKEGQKQNVYSGYRRTVWFQMIYICFSMLFFVIVVEILLYDLVKTIELHFCKIHILESLKKMKQISYF